MGGLLSLSRGIDTITEGIGKVVAWFVVLAVLVSVGNAVVRYTLPTYASNAYLELQWYLYGFVFLLGAAWTLKTNEHVRIDIATAHLSPRTKHKIDVFGTIVFLFPFVLLHLWFGWDYFYRSYQQNEVSTNAGGLLLWPAKFLILVGFFLLFIQGLSELIKRIAKLTGDLPDDHGAALDAHHAAAEAEIQRLIEATAAAEREKQR